MKYWPDVLSVFKVLILSIRPDSHFCPTFMVNCFYLFFLDKIHKKRIFKLFIFISCLFVVHGVELWQEVG